MRAGYTRMVWVIGVLVVSLTIISSVLFAATPKAKEPQKPQSVVQQPVAQQPTATPTAPAGISILNEIKDKYICVESGMTIREAAEAGAMCPSGARVEKYVIKMVESGWTRDDILGLLGMVQQGEPVCSALPNAQACSPDGKVTMESFIMSYCPYGVRMVDNVLPEMMKDLGDALVFTPRYILGKNEKGELSSMHGKDEVDEDLRQICIREKWGMAKWDAYFKCFSTNIFNMRGKPELKDWKFCADQAGIKQADLDACMKNDAPKLAEKDMELSKKYNAYASPTTVYNCSKAVVGMLPYNRIKSSCVCPQIKGQKPKACQ